MAVTVEQVPAALRWNNFREVDTLPDADEANELAQIRPELGAVQNIPIEQAPSGRLRLGDVTFTVGLDRRRTAVLRTATKTDELLQHEQGHQDLFFLAMRAMGRDLEAIEATDPSDLSQKVQDAQVLHHTRAETIDDLYDDETEHHANRKQQARWDAAIAAAKADAAASHILTHPL